MCYAIAAQENGNDATTQVLLPKSASVTSTASLALPSLLRAAATLRKLALHSVHVSTSAAYLISSNSSKAALRHFELHDCRVDSFRMLSCGVLRSKSLHTLRLSDCNGLWLQQQQHNQHLNDAKQHDVPRFGAPPCLAELELSHVALYRRDVLPLMKACAATLHTLRLSSCTVEDDDDDDDDASLFSLLLLAAQRISTICIRRCNAVGDAELAALASAQTHLQRIELVWLRRVTAAGVLAFGKRCIGANCGIRCLRFARLPVTDAAMQTMLALPNAQSLRHLGLRRCVLITDATLYSIALHCPRLEHLDLSGCRLVTNAGVQHVVSRCKQLTQLALVGCHNVDESFTI
jgi:F-box/leucine-rich repeat protein 2/20